MQNYFLIFFLLILFSAGCSVKYEEQLQSDLLYTSNLKDTVSSSLQSKCGISDISIAERDEFQFVDNSFIRTRILFADNQCRTEVGRLIYKGEIKADSTQEISEVTVKVRDEKFAKYLNTNRFCGFGAFHNGQSIVFRGEKTINLCPSGDLPNNVRAVQQLLSGR